MPTRTQVHGCDPPVWEEDALPSVGGLPLGPDGAVGLLPLGVLGQGVYNSLISTGVP